MKQKLGTLFIISALALAGIGASYAGFSDVLTIAGTVQTASVTFGIQEYSGTWVWKVFNAPDTGYGPETVVTHDPTVTYNPSEGFLVASAIAAPGLAPTDVQITFDNIFPCIPFVADIKFTIGTIPVKFTAVTIQPNPGSEWMAPLIASGDIFAKLYVIREGQQIPVIQCTQIHPGELVIGEIHIHLPQSNQYQGVSGSGTATLEILQWNEECGEGPFPGKTVLVPTTCTMLISHPYVEAGISAYWKTTISNFNPSTPPEGYNVEEGQPYLGWCIDFATLISQTTYYGVQMFSTYPGDEPWLPGELDEEGWQRINYVINHKESSDGQPEWKCVTWAIWYFVNGGSHPTSVGGVPGVYPGGITAVDNMIANANANPDWIPSAGDVVGVIMYYPGKQVTIIEVDP